MVGAILDNGQVVRVEFHHSIHRDQVVIGPSIYGRERRVHGSTLANLVVGPREDPESIGFGQALCSEADNYAKETGRQIALKRAVEGAVKEGKVSKEEGGRILKAYFDRKRT